MLVKGGFWVGLLPALVLRLAAAPLPVSPGFSLPTVDLAGEPERVVVVDREIGHYLGHPTTVLLEDGRTMLCVYPRGHGRGAIQLQRSRDGGRTWSGRRPVPENWATSLETPTLHRVIDAAGRQRLIVWSGLHPARLAVSEDKGETWSPLRAVGDWGGIVVMASVEAVRGKPGHYLAWFHDDGRYFRPNGILEKPVRFHLYQVRSEDGGLTWGTPRELWSGTEVQLCEPGVVRSPQGGQLALLLRENARRKNSHVMFSDDEGETWSAPREVSGALTGDRHTARYTPDGRLFVSFRDTARVTPTAGDWVGWVGTYDDLRLGREGQYRLRLADNTDRWDCAYPGVEVLPDATIVATTYGHWITNEPPYIISVRFKLAELDAKVAAGAVIPGAPPGVVVAHSLARTRQYLGSPSLLARPGGGLLASHDFFGPGSSSEVIHVHGSDDGGATWRKLSETRGFWCSLFEHRGAVYLLGSAHQNGPVVIRRSTDGARTWTEPVSAERGLLRSSGRFHGAPTPVVEHRGRLWRGMEDLGGTGGWAAYFRSFMLSVPVDADLLVAANWTSSTPLARDPGWLGGRFGGWLEGNAVVAPDGELVNLLRVDFRETDEKAARIHMSADGTTARFDPTTDLFSFPGGCKKFAVRADPQGSGYWSLANWIPPSQRGQPVERTRNTLALLHSADLVTWEVRSVLLHHPDREKHGFQYADFQIVGDDLLGLVRTAFADEGGGAPQAHDANFITFHRWSNFRSLTRNEDVAAGLSPRRGEFPDRQGKAVFPGP